MRRLEAVIGAAAATIVGLFCQLGAANHNATKSPPRQSFRLSRSQSCSMRLAARNVEVSRPLFALDLGLM